MQAVGYVRVSTEGQLDGVSLAAQRRRIQVWCEAKGYELVETHADEGISASRADNRPGLQSALAQACSLHAVLVAYDLTRLARSTTDAIHIAQKIQKCGAQLGLIMLDIDTTTAMGQYVFTMFAALGQLERQMTAERTRTSLSHIRSEGRRYTNTAPYGYRWSEEGRIVQHRGEQRTVKIMKELRRGGWGYKRIAAELDARRRPTRTGKPWNWGSVRSALQNKMREVEAERAG